MRIKNLAEDAERKPQRRKEKMKNKFFEKRYSSVFATSLLYMIQKDNFYALLF